MLTGAFGNVGKSTLLELIRQGHDVTCLDIETRANKRLSSHLQKQLGLPLNIAWGDITNQEFVNRVMKDIQCVIHVAALLPPKTEENATLTEKVNVGGTVNLIRAAEAQAVPPRFIFTSSVSVHGPLMPAPPPRKASDPLKPSDNYTLSKVKSEDFLRKSKLDWIIFRLGMVPPIEVKMGMDTTFFEIPLEQRVEFVDTRDVGLALANAVNADVHDHVFLIGGGKSCQMLERDFIGQMFKALGIGMLPDAAFKNPDGDEGWYYVDLLDTRDSQKHFNYQHHSYADYLSDVKRGLGFRYYFFRLFSSLIRSFLTKQSKYWRNRER
ncbi:MAG: NAD-dependent epimerase/dehydratase family protein [Promethearchaeota archaeon]